jgi:hypothetical protein
VQAGHFSDLALPDSLLVRSWQGNGKVCYLFVMFECGWMQVSNFTAMGQILLHDLCTYCLHDCSGSKTSIFLPEYQCQQISAQVRNEHNCIAIQEILFPTSTPKALKSSKNIAVL